MVRTEIDCLTGEQRVVPLSQEEVADAQAREAEEMASTPDRVRAKIMQMERDAMLPRASREFMLAYMEATFTAQQLAGNPGYQKMKAFDDQIKALREHL